MRCLLDPFNPVILVLPVTHIYPHYPLTINQLTPMLPTYYQHLLYPPFSSLFCARAHFHFPWIMRHPPQAPINQILEYPQIVWRGWPRWCGSDIWFLHKEGKGKHTGEKPPFLPCGCCYTGSWVRLVKCVCSFFIELIDSIWQLWRRANTQNVSRNSLPKANSKQENPLLFSCPDPEKSRALIGCMRTAHVSILQS